VKATLYPALLTVLVACGGNTYSQPKDDDFATDTADTASEDTATDTQDTAEDTGTGGDTGEDTGGGDTGGDTGSGNPLDACINAYDPVNVRNGYRSYDVMLGGAFAGASTQENFGEAYTSDGEEAYDVYEEMTSDAGVWTVDIFVTCRGSGSQTGMFYAEWQSPNGGTPPSAAMRYLPAEADMGSVGSWTYSFTTQVTTDLGAIDVDASGTFEEMGFERVVLFDGASFEAYHVRNTLHEDISAMGQAYPQDAIIDSWYVKGLGLVRETIENSADGTMVLTRELTGYGEFSPE